MLNVAVVHGVFSNIVVSQRSMGLHSFWVNHAARFDGAIFFLQGGNAISRQNRSRKKNLLCCKPQQGLGVKLHGPQETAHRARCCPHKRTLIPERSGPELACQVLLRTLPMKRP